MKAKKPLPGEIWDWDPEFNGSDPFKVLSVKVRGEAECIVDLYYISDGDIVPTRYMFLSRAYLVKPYNENQD